MKRLESLLTKGGNTMKKSLALLILASLVMCLPASALKFKDMKDDHWAAPAVYDLVKRGITDGFPDGTFRGNEDLTRYQTAVFLYKMANSIEKNVDAKISRALRRAPAVKGGGSPVSATVFARYQKALSNSAVTNNFDITRAYLTLQGPISSNAAGKVTLDANNGSRTVGTGSMAFLKYAYVDLLNVIPEGAIPGVVVDTRIGLQPTYWSAWVDGILGLRVVAASLQANQALAPTADFGIGALGTIDLMGTNANYVMTATNGNGFTAGETNSTKDVAVRLDAEVMPGVILAGGAQINNVGTSGTGTKQLNLLGAYQVDAFTAYLEALYGLNGLGFSVAGIYDATEDVGLFARADLWDPLRSNNSSADQITNIWAGVTYDWNDNVMIVADAMSAQVGSGTAAITGTLRTQIDL